MTLPRPRRYEIHLWSWCLDSDSLSGDAGEALLNDAEKARSRRFVTAVLQQRFVAARSRVRALLGAYLGRDPANSASHASPIGPTFISASAIRRIAPCWR
jgi:4'-phosphopantetheinyl transferase